MVKTRSGRLTIPVPVGHRCYGPGPDAWRFGISAELVFDVADADRSWDDVAEELEDRLGSWLRDRGDVYTTGASPGDRCRHVESVTVWFEGFTDDDPDELARQAAVVCLDFLEAQAVVVTGSRNLVTILPEWITSREAQARGMSFSEIRALSTSRL